MALTVAPVTEALDRLTRDLPSLSATQLVSGMQKATRAVMSKGAVVITRHDQPAMVLLSIERYLELEHAAEPNLDALTRRFDDLFERMQRSEAAQAMADAFAMDSEELGESALRAAAATVRGRAD